MTMTTTAETTATTTTTMTTWLTLGAVVTVAAAAAWTAGCANAVDGDAAVAAEATPRDAALGAGAGAGFFGMSTDQSGAGFDDAQAATLAALGVTRVRLQLCDWPARVDRMDREVDAARAHGLLVYAEINYCTIESPSDPPPYRARQRMWHEGFSDAGNDYAHAFAAAAGDMAAHFRGRVAAWEIWNEPDAAPRPFGFSAQHFWPSPGDADWDGACGDYDYGVDYEQAAWALCPRQLGAVTTNAFMTIKAADPDALVVAGNLLLHGDDGWVAKEYLKALERSPAVQWHVTHKGRVPWDVVGVHPYGWTADAYRPATFDFQPGDLGAVLDDLRGILDARGDAAALAITEYGFPTGGDDRLVVSPADQARLLEGAFRVARSRGLAFLVWFNFLDAPDLHYGVVDDTGAWKEGADAYCRAAGAAACPTGRTPPAPPEAAPGVGRRGDGSVSGGIVDCWARSGGDDASGAPFDNGGGALVHRWGGGEVQDFAGGFLGPTICMERGGDGFALLVRGDIRRAYFAGGGAGGLGYPIDEEHDSPTGPRQTFERAVITWDGARYAVFPR